MPDEILYLAPLGDGGQYAAPAHICPACVGGWHGEQCQESYWTTGEPPELVECDCTEGACRGEWVEVGYLDEGSIGPPLPVLGFDGSREDGVIVHVSLPPDHPAYAAVHAGLTDHLSIGPNSVGFPADNERYVKSPRARQPMHAGRDTRIRPVTLASPTVNGLGREHIVEHLPLEHRVPYVHLSEKFGGLPEDAPERHPVRPNRADRRRKPPKKGRNRAR